MKQWMEHAFATDRWMAFDIIKNGWPLI